MWHGTVRLAGALAAAQLGLHIWFGISAGDPRMVMPHVVAWVLDAFVLTVAAAMLCGLGAAVRRCQVPQAWLLFGVNVPVFLVGLLLASYPGLLTEFLAFPTNIFRADAGTATFFVSEYLGWRGLWPLLVSGAAALLATRVTRRVPLPPRTLWAVALPVILLATAALLRPAPHPLVYSIQDLMTGWLTGGRREVPSLSRPTGAMADAEASPVGEFPLDGETTLRYDHVVISVLEGVTAARFEQEFLTRPQGYYAHVRDRSAYYGGYHTTNLDSYTSLIAMLTSVQVPYRAYADPRSYEAVNDAQNIVATLRGAGFGTLFVSTAEYHPFVPVPRDWTRVIGMHDLQQREGWVAVTGSKVEAGVEDRAALPAIVDFVSSHSRALVMHEMLFGHSPRWTAKTGKSQLEYYDAYLLELVRDLQRKDLLDRTLLVVVSDHGDRADSFDVENYRVPLLVSGRGIPPSQTNDHLCHTDFQRIIGHFLAGRLPPKASASFLTVGSTERWVYGEIAARGGYLFIDNDSGAVVSRHGGLDARSVFDRFQHQLNVFAACHQR